MWGSQGQEGCRAPLLRRMSLAESLALVKPHNRTDFAPPAARAAPPQALSPASGRQAWSCLHLSAPLPPTFWEVSSDTISV